MHYPKCKLKTTSRKVGFFVTIKIMNYEIKESAKARRVRITIFPDDRVVVTKPRRVGMIATQKFVQAKQKWIEKKLVQIQRRQKLSREHLPSKSQVLEFVNQKIAQFNAHYNLEVNRVQIRDQKSLWGSCSRGKNLSFNQRIILLPEYQADYIIVHELCHLREFNHSSKFWQLVAETIPDFARIRRELREYSFG